MEITQNKLDTRIKDPVRHPGQASHAITLTDKLTTANNLDAHSLHVEIDA